MFLPLAIASGNIQEWGDVSLSQAFLSAFKMGSLSAGVAGLGEPKPDAAGCRLGPAKEETA